MPKPPFTPPKPPIGAAGLTEAVVLLRQAFGNRANVQHSGADVVVKLPNGVTHELTLVPHPAEAPARLQRANAPTVLVFTRASKDVRAILRDRGQSYIDLSGAVHLALPWAIVDRADLEPVRSQSSQSIFSSSADPFTDKSSLVLRVMLEPRDTTRVWGVLELSKTAGVAPATASAVLQSLAQRGLVRFLRVGRAAQVSLGSPTAVISAWTRAYDWRLNRGIAVEAPIGDPTRFIRMLPKLMRDVFAPTRSPGGAAGVATRVPRWALTLQSGASLVAPHATWDRIHAYVDIPHRRGERERFVAQFGLRTGWPAAPHGKLVIMWPHYTHSAWHGMRVVSAGSGAGGIPVVSDLQLVLDLWHYPLRGEEQAKHIFHRMFPNAPRG